MLCLTVDPLTHQGNVNSSMSHRPILIAYMRFPSCRTQHTQRNGHTACDAIKNLNTQRMHAKNTTHAIISILCVHCVFRVCVRCGFFICVT